MVTLVRLSAFITVSTNLLNDPCDKIVGLENLDSIVGWTTSTFFWFALPCLLYTYIHALVPSTSSRILTDATENNALGVCDTVISGDEVTSCDIVMPKTREQASDGFPHAERGVASVQAKYFFPMLMEVAEYIMRLFMEIYMRVVVIVEDFFEYCFRWYLSKLEIIGSKVLDDVHVKLLTPFDYLKEEKEELFVGSAGRDIEVCWYVIGEDTRSYEVSQSVLLINYSVLIRH